MNKYLVVSMVLLWPLCAASCQTAESHQAGTDQAASPLTFEQLTKAGRVYFRDSTEFPMTQKFTFTVSDASGHVKKVNHLTLDYLFNGYRPKTKTATGSSRANISFWAAIRGAKMVKASMNNALWTMIAGITLTDDPGDYKLEAHENGSNDRVITARLTPTKSCATITMEKNPQVYFPDDVCGTREYQLQDNLSFQKFVFDATGLPATVKIETLGKSILRSYHVEIAFQKVTLPGDKEPFLVPKQVTAKLESNKGNVEITSLYEAKSSNHR
jgi:hypothetical protein